jgi:hypothetical protein
VGDWEELARRAQERYEDGASRLPSEPDERQRQLTRMGNAAWAAGLCLLMAAREDEAAAWLVQAAETYRRSFADAPPGSWGRPIGAMKSRLIARDRDGALEDARWALDVGAAESASPIGRYAATLARLVRGEDEAAASLTASIVDVEAIPAPVVDALSALAAHAEADYAEAIAALVANFEARTDFLEDVPVADTVLALQALARERDIGVALESRLLPDGRCAR